MGEIQKLYVTLALDAAQYEQGLRQAQESAQGLRGRVGGALGQLQTVGQAALLGVGAAAVGGFGMAMKSAIDMNASLETSRLQFTTLMGDADAANEHVAMLFAFAANTPFESQQIIDASLALQTFGGAALNTQDNLTLVGDAAAAVGAPIDEVSFWVGRLYSNLQAGQPFGEAAARLQELGIMSPQARAELEALQATGASGNEVWQAAQGHLAEFSGAMELQAGTWQGLTSTIKDNLTMAAAEGLKPFFDLAKEGLAGLAEWLSSPEVQQGIKNLAAGIQELLTKVGDFVREQVVPFVQKHGPEIKGALAALGVVILATVIPAVVSLVASMLPLIVVVGAVMAVGALLAKAWNENWGGIREKTEAVVTFVRELIERFLTRVRDWWEEHGEAIKAAAKEAWEFIQERIEYARDQIQRVIEAFIALFTGDWETFLEKVKEIWQAAWNETVEVLSKLWEWIQPKLVAMWESIKTWFQDKMADWRSLGEKIIDGIKQGLENAKQQVLDFISGLATELLDTIKAALGIHSPAATMVPVGVGIVQGIIEGIEAETPELLYGLEQLTYEVGAMLEFADQFGSIGGGFAKHFERTVMDPIEQQMGELDGVIEGMEPLWERAFGFMNAEMVDWRNPANFATAMRQLVMLRNAIASQGPTSAQFLPQVDEAIQALMERNNLNAEYVRQQERLLALEKARADLDFLKSQLELLKLVKDNNLDARILDGLEFGLGADAGALMDAMVDVMKRLVNAANAELRIHSPSGVFEDIGQQVMAGMARGLSDTRAIERSLEQGLSVVMEAGTGATAGQGRTTINGGYNVTVYGNRTPALDEMEILTR